MTSQLTPERTSVPTKTEETSERILILQPWFFTAVLCVIAMVVFIALG